MITPDALFAYLDRLGIAHPTISHPPMFTVNEAQSLRGSLPGGHNKNLFLKDRFGDLYLVVLLEDARINLKTLPGILECGRVSFGSAELLREVLGVEPGSVTPFALINDKDHRVTPVLDQHHDHLDRPRRFAPVHPVDRTYPADSAGGRPAGRLVCPIAFAITVAI
jgi:Ala-tRNA(Pro) deacylase